MQTLVLFSDADVARACKSLVHTTTKPTSSYSVSLRVIEFEATDMPEHALRPRLLLAYAVVYSYRFSDTASLFWWLMGTGISSCQVGCCLLVVLDSIWEIDDGAVSQSPPYHAP